tara:strand:- start:812 stop:979 length:168 start_codon:yes stop_codon:yes gene_type:complete
MSRIKKIITTGKYFNSFFSFFDSLLMLLFLLNMLFLRNLILPNGPGYHTAGGLGG